MGGSKKLAPRFGLNVCGARGRVRDWKIGSMFLKTQHSTDGYCTGLFYFEFYMSCKLLEAALLTLVK